MFLYKVQILRIGENLTMFVRARLIETISPRDNSRYINVQSTQEVGGKYPVMYNIK